MCVDAAFAAVEIAVTETIAPSATNAAKIASLRRVLRWRIAMLARWFISSSLVNGFYYKTETIGDVSDYK